MGAEAFVAAQIVDFAEATDDRVASLLVAGSGISIAYNDGAGTLTIASTVSPTWGSIGGTLSNQTDLQTALNGKAATTHTHVIADTTGLQASLDAKLNLSGGTLTGKLQTLAGDYFNAGLEIGSSVGVYDSSGLVVRYGGQECLQLNQSELSLRSSQEIGWTGTTSATGAIDSKFVRNGSGQVDFRGDNGLRVRNLANNAFTNVTANSFISSSLTITGGSPSNFVSSNRITFTGSAAYIFYKGGNQFTIDPSGSDAATFGGAVIATNITATGLVTVGTYTVATLPSAAANPGRLAQVTDSSVTTNGSAVAGGGSSRVVVFSNGSTWDVVVA